jgi:FAD:protein FMN transferase
MTRLFLLLFLFSFLFCSFIETPALKRIQIEGLAQGTTYHIIYYANDSLVNKQQVDSILDKIDSSLSLYKSYSLINQFNHSQDGVKVDLHFAKVVKKAIEIYHHTNGLFDITVEPLTTVWGFGPMKATTIPDSATIKNILPCVSSSLLYWEGRKLKKKKSCVRLDANGIAQGYSVDVLADFFERQGVKNYVIELGGEIRVKGHKHPGNEKMKIGIETPGDDPDFFLIEKVVWLDSGAITTSGNYRRYYESDGKKITHLLNPKTGYSLQNELISVTVYAKDAITADGYDNALMAMGLKKAMAFVGKRKDMAAHFIYQKKDGTIADTMSKRFAVLLKP